MSSNSDELNVRKLNVSEELIVQGADGIEIKIGDRGIVIKDDKGNSCEVIIGSDFPQIAVWVNGTLAATAIQASSDNEYINIVPRLKALEEKVQKLEGK